jgi:hypothetical protein
MLGKGLTVTVTCAVSKHPFTSVPMTEYTVVESGVDMTDAAVVELRPEAGDHTYVEAPVAVNVALNPGQTDLLVPPLTLGLGRTTRVICVESRHPLKPTSV